MARPRGKRPTSVTVYFSDYDKRWHGYITMGVKPDGSPDRRQRSGKSRDEVAEKIRTLEDQIAAGTTRQPGRRPTVREYLVSWLAQLDLRYKTLEDYTRVAHTHLIPHLGNHRIDALRTDHVKAMLRAVEADLSASAAHRAHRVLRAALADAVREELIPRNVARLVRPPRVEEKEVAPLTVAEVRAVLAEIDRMPRNRGRWLLALTIGMRQGECLALARHRADQPRLSGDLDLAAGTLTVRKKLLRHKWRHGCADPVACARWRHGCAGPGECQPTAERCPKRRVRCRTEPCPVRWAHGCLDPAACPKTLAYACPQRIPKPGCADHRGRKGCPPPCSPGCVGHARSCPQRTGGGLVMEPPKSTAGKRTIALPPPVLAALQRDAAVQSADKAAVGQLWIDSGLVFTTPLGRPIDPRADYQQWRDMLAAAGVAPARLHDARHTAATFLLVLGVDERTVMDVMGWSQKSMLDRYQHVVSELRREAANRVGAMWWPSPNGVSGAGSATDHATIPGQRLSEDNRSMSLTSQNT